MTDFEIFERGHWIEAQSRDACPVMRKKFFLDEVPQTAGLRIVGFGGFVMFINGVRVGEDLMLPLNSNFEDRNYPTNEQMGTRTYVHRIDVSRYLKPGKNVLAVILGNGWYTGVPMEKPYGAKKLRFCLKAGNEMFYSDSDVKWAPSFVTESVFTGSETHDFSFWDENCLSAEFDDSAWRNTAFSPTPETEFMFSDCPLDKVREHMQFMFLREIKGARLYDAGENISGYPVLESTDKGVITVEFSEELNAVGGLDTLHGYGQKLTFVSKKAGQILCPLFCWIGFRYFSVSGNAKVADVCKIHADVKCGSGFSSDNSTLDWIYKTYLNTQLCNMHAGIPSDCPQIERRGYTGDGQLCANAAMTVFEPDSCGRFYKKWIGDISDCQDRFSGHVQYTAPYTHSGGGPGGWGSAIVTVPYHYWKHYGDVTFARELYPQMKKYFDYLEAHSENMLVTSDRAGEWCLGEWCTPFRVILPAPFVNNIFYVRALNLAASIAAHIGKEEDIPAFYERAEKRKKAITAAYFNPWDGNFVGNVQGANAFALSIGLGDERTKKNFISHYRENPCYDTGIFGTELVTKLLFEYGEKDLAFSLLTADDPHGFGKWKKDGATTLWEYWGKSRSHSHPMFGSVTECLFEDILGIKQKENSFGYADTVICPKVPGTLNSVSGFVDTVRGRISAEYTRAGAKLYLKANIDFPCEFVHPDGRRENLEKGEHTLEV